MAIREHRFIITVKLDHDSKLSLSGYVSDGSEITQINMWQKGPTKQNSVQWVFRNGVTREREQRNCSDTVRTITETRYR